MILRRLAGIRYEAASSLLIRYSLSAFIVSMQKSTRGSAGLLPARSGAAALRRRPRADFWSAIARELAVAPFPENDPGLIAASLKEV